MKKVPWKKVLVVFAVILISLSQIRSVFAVSYLDVYNFDYTNGYQSSGYLLKASNGSLYGLTSGGGVNGNGVLFKFDPSTNTETKLVDFDGTNGTNPYGSLMQANDGNIYGMTYIGGINDMGVIFKFDPVAESFTKIYDFDSAGGGNPFGALIQGTDGKLYGATYYGGANNLGVIFSLNLVGNVYTKLYSFTDITGSHPHGTLFQASNGMMYGLTPFGGAHTVGVVFKFNPVGNVYTDIYDFDNTNGASAFGSLMSASDGKLYGMTRDGGANFAGIIFNINITNDLFTKVFDLDVPTGCGPYGTLMQATDGKLYGNTYQGGTTNEGTVFRFDITSNTYTKLTDLSYSTGRRPYEALTEANNGLLYGMTFDGGAGDGVIYSYNTTMRAPDAPTDLSLGTSSNTSIILTWNAPADSNGSAITGYKIERKSSTDADFSTIVDNYSGTTYTDTSAQTYEDYAYRIRAINAIGTSAPSNTASVLLGNYESLAQFDSTTTGGSPSSDLVSVGGGAYYGLNSYGGSGNSGTIFKFDSSTNTITAEYNFNSTDGSPTGTLLYASDGMLYGVTNSGGLNNMGEIFRFNPSTKVYSDIFDFDMLPGWNPYGYLTEVGGVIYGVTTNGGANNEGAIYKIDPTTLVYTKLYDFTDPTGISPQSGPVEYTGGILYGTTGGGGLNSAGNIYMFDTHTNTYTDIYDFDCTYGCYSSTTLTKAYSGNLFYGVTSSGGAHNGGSIFKFDPSNNTFTQLYSIMNSVDGFLYVPLLDVGDGYLYILGNSNGLSNNGTILRFSLSTNTLEKIHDFDGVSGGTPISRLLPVSDGIMYGLTQGGGTSGVLYKITTHLHVNPPQGGGGGGRNGGGLLAYIQNHPVVEPPKENIGPTKALLTDKLFLGSRGPQVTLLQTILGNIKYFSGIIDGRFGRKTYAGVKAFQKANKLKTDGIVGAKTRALLNK